MIVPMKKVTLVVLDREREKALKALRKVGVLHVEGRPAESADLVELERAAARLDHAYSILAEIKLPDAGRGGDSPRLDRAETFALVDRVYTLSDERHAAREEAARIESELGRLRPWGAVDPADFDYLAERGIYLFPFEMSVEDYTGLPESVRTIVVGRDKKVIRLVVWGESDLLHEGIPASARELVLPEKSTRALEADLARVRKIVPAIDERLRADAARKESILALRAELGREIEFERVRAGMPLLALSAREEGSAGPDADVAWLTGFAPADEVHRLEEAARKNGWALAADDPADEDNVPTKVRNNRLVNLISPLLDFLGTVPGYREIDISAWFLLFFGIFFAMIFGDGGYGVLLAVLSVFGILKSRAKGEKPHVGLYMFLYLSLMTVAWGAATCTWFGVPVELLPASLRSIAIPAFSNENPDAATNIKIFCFALGLAQISLAHVIGIIRNIRSLKVLGELGALMLTVGMFFVVLNLVVDAERFPLTNPVLGLVGGGFLLNFAFINYAGSVGGGILESLKNIITMLLGVVNMFGDIMSYIRLWAVGLAGSAISATVNAMAGPFLGGFALFAAAAVLLLFGHGLNFVMNVLSVIVHGVRLNTLEFSNHLGLTWSGFKYEPFSETGKK